MIPNRVRSSEVELGPRHCPAAVVHARLGTPREPSHEMMTGKTTHAVAEAVAVDRDRPAHEVADDAVIAMVRDGMSFEGGKPEYPALEEACAGRRLAIATLDRHPLPTAQWMQAELEVNMTPNGWGIVEAYRCRDCAGAECANCGGEGETWSPHWHQLLDLCWQAEGEDAYENPVLVAGGRDYKGWDAGADWFDRLQGAGYAVSLATLFPEAQILRRECVGYQTRSLYEDEIDLRTEEGQDRLSDYRQDLELAVRAQMAQPLDVEAVAMPGAGCASGYGGCPYFRRCPPAMRRAAELGGMAQLGGLVLDSAAAAADAYGLGEALRLEGASQLKGYGGGPIRVPSGQLVGWKDTTSPTGKVAPNATLWLAREYAMFVLQRPDDAEKIEGVLKAAGIGKGGKGVTGVRSVVARCVAAGMTPEDGEALLGRCLVSKPGRVLAIWRGDLPEEPEDADLVEKLRASLEIAGK